MNRRVSDQVFVDECVVIDPETIIEKCEFHDCTFKLSGDGGIIRDCEIYYTRSMFPLGDSVSFVDLWSLWDTGSFVCRVENNLFHAPSLHSAP